MRCRGDHLVDFLARLGQPVLLVQRAGDAQAAEQAYRNILEDYEFPWASPLLSNTSACWRRISKR